ncbi:MAG: PqiC family protein [Chthoniobacteraceae bacterium]
MKTRISAFLLPLLFASCSILQPVRDISVNHLLEPGIPARRITGSSPAIAIARPALPSYLDRQQLVARRGGELKMNPNQLWAEPLGAGISRVMALNLGRLTNSLNIQPVESFITPDYQKLLELRISRFEPDGSGRVILECTWKLQPLAPSRVASTRSFSTSVPILRPVALTSVEAQSGQVAAMNEALARLARDIAGAF